MTVNRRCECQSRWKYLASCSAVGSPAKGKIIE